MLCEIGAVETFSYGAGARFTSGSYCTGRVKACLDWYYKTHPLFLLDFGFPQALFFHSFLSDALLPDVLTGGQ